MEARQLPYCFSYRETFIINRGKDINLEIIHQNKSTVLKFYVENGFGYCLCPLDTELKIKFYFGVNDS